MFVFSWLRRFLIISVYRLEMFGLETKSVVCVEEVAHLRWLWRDCARKMPAGTPALLGLRAALGLVERSKFICNFPRQGNSGVRGSEWA